MVAVKDPVCGMNVEPAQAAGRADYGGKTYFFCSAQCKRNFEANPQKYATASPKTPGGAHGGH